nr:putative agmatinase 3 [Quercus suber]
MYSPTYLLNYLGPLASIKSAAVLTLQRASQFSILSSQRFDVAMLAAHIKALLCFFGLAAAREITFPPVSGYQHPFVGQTGLISDFSEDLDISSTLYSGLTTYANLPYVHCLASEGEVETYDIAIVGAPFDTAVTARPGARFGPNGIRQGSRRISAGFAWNVYDGRNYFKEGFKVVDCGDAPLTFLVPLTGVNHGTFLHIAHEEGLILNSSMHAGIRAPVTNKRSDLAHDKACGFHIVKARDLDKFGLQGIIDKLKARTLGTKVYISVDIDVLDPAFAPATGTAEVGGWSTRELLTILDGLVGMEVVGGDVVEVAPIYDNPGETTVLAAAEVVHALIGLMAATPVKSIIG